MPDRPATAMFTPVDDLDEVVDVLAVGAGPANLSLAALLTPLGSVSLRLLERRREVRWHPGLLLPDARMQVSFLKDLVTPVLPTSPLSFVAFLVEHKRFYRFTAAGYDRPSRAEFDQYLRWAAARLPAIEYDQRVELIDLRGDVFDVRTHGGTVHQARDLVLGTGPRPSVPDCARRHLGPTLFHAGEYLAHQPRPDQGRRVAVVGGGQSGAEVVLDLLSRGCRDLVWLTRRDNLLPLDDSPFTNELFTPAYAARFAALDARARRDLLAGQVLASDGISLEILQRIYHHLYQFDCVDGARRPMVDIRPEQDLVAVEPRAGGGWRLVTRHTRDAQVTEESADTVILATGYTQELPDILAPLRGRISLTDGFPELRADFSLVWDGPPDRRIFLQNAARHSHGIADPNLSLLAWRAAVIVNSLLGKDVYDVTDLPSMLSWAGARDGDQL
jgi:lysine N6-hydroxylase